MNIQPVTLIQGNTLKLCDKGLLIRKAGRCPKSSKRERGWWMGSGQ